MKGTKHYGLDLFPLVITLCTIQSILYLILRVILELTLDYLLFSDQSIYVVVSDAGYIVVRVTPKSFDLCLRSNLHSVLHRSCLRFRSGTSYDSRENDLKISYVAGIHKFE